MAIIEKIKYADTYCLLSPKEVVNEIDRILAYLDEAILALTDEELRNQDNIDWFTVQIEWIHGLYSLLEGMIGG